MFNNGLIYEWKNKKRETREEKVIFFHHTWESSNSKSLCVLYWDINLLISVRCICWDDDCVYISSLSLHPPHKYTSYLYQIQWFLLFGVFFLPPLTRTLNHHETSPFIVCALSSVFLWEFISLSKWLNTLDDFRRSWTMRLLTGFPYKNLPSSSPPHKAELWGNS